MGCRCTCSLQDFFPSYDFFLPLMTTHFSTPGMEKCTSIQLVGNVQCLYGFVWKGNAQKNQLSLITIFSELQKNVHTLFLILSSLKTCRFVSYIVLICGTPIFTTPMILSRQTHHMTSSHTTERRFCFYSQFKNMFSTYMMCVYCRLNTVNHIDGLPYKINENISFQKHFIIKVYTYNLIYESCNAEDEHQKLKII